jgi:HAMP domain-containing protein
VGVFCALIGGLMLVAPHQFAASTFQPIRPWLTQAGVLYFLAGVALVAASAVVARGPWMVAATSMAGTVLLTLATSFVMTGDWTGAAIYAVLAVATCLSPLCDVDSDPPKESIDLFVLTAAVASLANGLLLLTLTAGGVGVFYDPLFPTIGWHGALFLTGGLGVLVTRLRPGILRPAKIVAQLMLGFAFLAWVIGSSIPNRIWTDILLNGSIGTMLVLGPPLARRIARLDPSSLRVRLALAMASAAAFPLLVVAAIATGWEEQAAANQQLALQQAVASGLAADVSGALTQHVVGLTLVAEHPVVLARSSAGREALLGDVGEVAPGFNTLGTFDGAGRPLVVLGRRSDEAAARLPALAAEALRRIPPGLGRPTPFLMSGDDPSIVLAVPIRQDGGALGGVAVGELDRRWLEARLQRGVGEGRVGAVVVDSEGRAVVAAGLAAAAGQPIRAGSSADLAVLPPIQALRERSQNGGTLRFMVGNNEYLAGYARVAETDWAVVVEQPVATALATVWFSRELTFGVLVAAFLVAASLGALLASRLATPLALLARAAQALAAGAPTSLMPRSHVYEVRVVARAFAEMQSRLLARTS